MKRAVLLSSVFTLPSRMGSNSREAEEEEEEKWVTHYSSHHQILLVGEGDFSFSLSLANSFGSASNICASSLDSREVLVKKYKKAKSNLEDLEKLGATLLYEVDATKMKLHTDLSKRKFDRIIFNFPHAGFYGREDNALLIKRHRDLVQGFFRSARGMLRVNGEIHVNHKTKKPFCNWNVEELAFMNSLALIEIADFRKEDYRGYNNKRGDGLRCDEPFFLGECSTFKFRFSPTAKKMSRASRRAGKTHQQPRHSQDFWIKMQQQSRKSLVPDTSHILLLDGSASTVINMRKGFPTRTVGAMDQQHQQSQGIPMQKHLQPTSDFIYPRRNHIPLNIGPPFIAHTADDSVTRIAARMRLQPQQCSGFPIQEQLQPPYSDLICSQKSRIVDMSRIPQHMGLSSIPNTRNVSSSIYEGCLARCPVHPIDTGYSVLDMMMPLPGGMMHGLERLRVEVPRTFHDDLYYLHEQRHVSFLSQAW